MKSVLHQILERSGFSPITKRNYGRIIDRWVDFAGADPNGWNPDKAQAFYDQLIDGGLSPRSANVYLAGLRYVSKWHATKTHGIDFAVVQKQRGLKGHSKQGESRRYDILTPEEITALVETCRGKSPVDLRDLAMLVIGLETGMRRMSLRGLSFEGMRRTSYPSVVVPIKGPGGEETYNVPLSDTAALALAPWVAWAQSKKIGKGAVFRRLTRNANKPPTIGDSLTDTGINEIVAARSDAAGIRHVNPHLLRHTFISTRIIAGFNTLQIGVITGHKPGTITVDGLRMNLGGMQAYIHHEVEPIRNSTPPWLAELVRDLLH